jgi:hypothetical protein
MPLLLQVHLHRVTPQVPLLQLLLLVVLVGLHLIDPVQSSHSMTAMQGPPLLLLVVWPPLLIVLLLLRSCCCCRGRLLSLLLLLVMHHLIH